MKKNILIALVLYSFSLHSKQECMRLYSFYTDSHAVFKDDWFLPSLKATNSDLEETVKYYGQECPSAEYLKSGWNQTMLRKVEMILEAIEENWNEIFIYADIDIQFFKPMKEIIEKEMEGYDMVVQKDRPDGLICAGFFACRANEKTKKLWQGIAAHMKSYPADDDQNTLNMLIYQPKFNINWKHFSADFLSGGTLTGKRWAPGEHIPVPHNIVLHHANWTIGINNKIAQLKYVRGIVNSYCGQKN